MTTQFSPELRGQYKAKAYAAANAKSALVPFTIPRRNPGEHDVQIEILFCYICHSDLHQVRNEWSTAPTVYPCVPGHEIVGRVTKVGDDLRKEIGGRLDPDDKEAKARLKDHYQEQFSKTIDDAKTAHRKGDSSMAMWHERLASDVHDIIKLLE